MNEYTSICSGEGERERNEKRREERKNEREKEYVLLPSSSLPSREKKRILPATFYSDLPSIEYENCLVTGARVSPLPISRHSLSYSNYILDYKYKHLSRSRSLSQSFIHRGDGWRRISVIVEHRLQRFIASS